MNAWTKTALVSALGAVAAIAEAFATGNGAALTDWVAQNHFAWAVPVGGLVAYVAHNLISTYAPPPTTDNLNAYPVSNVPVTK